MSANKKVNKKQTDYAVADLSLPLEEKMEIAEYEMRV